MESPKAGTVQPEQRMTLTRGEYDRARDFVADRPEKLSELGIDSNEKLPWENPDYPHGLKVQLRESAHVDLATWARTEPSERLIDFFRDAKNEYSPGSLGFGSRYVHAWRELDRRVRMFERGLLDENAHAEERERRAEERADRAEKRARVSTVVAIIAVLIAGITLVLRFFQ